MKFFHSHLNPFAFVFSKTSQKRPKAKRKNLKSLQGMRFQLVALVPGTIPKPGNYDKKLRLRNGITNTFFENAINTLQAFHAMIFKSLL